MLNQKPIFLFCFSRGGSNIFWNLFLTHPDACSPIHESLQLFGLGRNTTKAGWLSVLLTRQVRFFDQKYARPRRTISARAQAHIDRVLFQAKLQTFNDADMREKAEGQYYTLDEVKAAHLVTKNNNGLVFLGDIFRQMYPEATFFALVRHPLPLYESHKRHQFVGSVDEFATFYETIAQKMVSDAARYDDYHLVRFEDMLRDPVETWRQVMRQAGLDEERAPKMRLKAKAHFNDQGVRTSAFEVGKHYWFAPEMVGQYFEQDINQHQVERLDTVERKQLADRLQPLIHSLGYTS